MMSRTTTFSRILGAAALGLASVGLTGGSASAESPPLPYSCSWYVTEVDGTGGATATWDSAIPDGYTTTGWEPFSLDPYTGTVVLPDAFVETLRAQGVSEVSGGGQQVVWWDLVGTPHSIDLRFPATPVPTTGPMTLELTGVDAGTFSHSDAETFLLIAAEFSLATDDGTSGLSCTPVSGREGERVIDSVTVTYSAPSPTGTTAPTTTTPGQSPTAPATAPPVRPALVQTDQPQSSGTVAPLALGVVAVAVAAGAAAAWAGRSRRH